MILQKDNVNSKSLTGFTDYWSWWITKNTERWQCTKAYYSNVPDKTHLPDTQNETEASPWEIASLAFHLL